VGAPVTFTLGGIVIGSAPGKAIVTPADFVPGGSADTPLVQDISRFLMTLDSDNDATNGITIDSETFATAQGLPDLPWQTVTDEDFVTILGQLGCPFPLVSRDEARAELEGNILALFVGNWSATGTDGTRPISLDLFIATDGTIGGDVTIGTEVLAVTGTVFTDSTFVVTDVDGTTYTGTMDPAEKRFTGTAATSTGGTGRFGGRMV